MSHLALGDHSLSRYDRPCSWPRRCHGEIATPHGDRECRALLLTRSRPPTSNRPSPGGDATSGNDTDSDSLAGFFSSLGFSPRANCWRPSSRRSPASLKVTGR